MTSVKVPHKPCGETGVVVRPRMLEQLYLPYLPEAEQLPGLGEKRLAEPDIEEMTFDVLFENDRIATVRLGMDRSGVDDASTA